eukprot:gb/GECG01011766.1/.p1 GENE.gb/GECG01011766.1/~~gb/GECG01011766.1/.p1  ORF type:complete len:104 (+),score=5.54 gb/GECG01011766.1/:1-312(+)
MAGDELRKKYGKCVCCQMVCPPWDCEETVLPHQMDDEVAFVAKPNKFLLCCLPIPFPGIGVCCIAPWLSIDVHCESFEALSTIVPCSQEYPAVPIQLLMRMAT